MSDPVDALILDLLEWIGPGPRPYPEVMEAWRTSCPRLPVWEEANRRGFIEHLHEPGRPATIAVSRLGSAHLQRHRVHGGAVVLRPMNESAYPAFFDQAVNGYAEENVASGRWAAAEAVELARSETERLLPLGIATPDHHLYEIRPHADEQAVGFLWAAAMHRGTRKVAFVYQLHVFEPFRRQGHGRAALVEFERMATEMGFHGIALNVFGSNAAAQALYRSLGFITTSISMHKDLSRDGE